MMLTKFSIAVALINPVNNIEVLAVKRPENDDALPNVWGLPAITPKSGELPEAAVRRLGLEKLSADIVAKSLIGVRDIERVGYKLILMDLEALLVDGVPTVENAQSDGTVYSDLLWTSDYSIFLEAARKGSLCSRIFLESKGISWQQ